MKSAWIITQKEFARFFKSKFSAFSAIFLPGILMGILYTAIGYMPAFDAVKEDDNLLVAGENIPDFLTQNAQDLHMTFLDIPCDVTDEEALREAIEEEKFYAYVVFPRDFENTARNYAVSMNTPAPHVSIYFDETNVKSLATFTSLRDTLNTFESTLSNNFDINTHNEKYNVGSQEKSTAQMISGIIPMLILLTLFQAITAISAESIAGEKERGTIATILATPIQRKAIVWGKLTTITIIALLTATFSLLGITIGLKNMIGDGMSIARYGMKEMTMIALILIPFALISSVLAVLISALSKTIKEAQVYLTSAQIIISGLAVIVGLSPTPDAPLAWQLIPFYNTAYNLVETLALESSILPIVMSALVNFTLAVGGVFVVERIINSEKFMFQR